MKYSIKFIKLKYHQIQKFTNNADFKKQDFSGEEKISDRSGFDSIKVVTCKEQWKTGLFKWGINKVLFSQVGVSSKFSILMFLKNKK